MPILNLPAKICQGVHNILNEQEKNFLLSFKSAIPNWDLIDIKGLSELPVIKWKLLNTKKLAQENPKDMLILCIS